MRGTKTIHNISDQVFGKLPPRKISPRSGSVFGLGLVLELGLGAIFLGDNFPRTIRSKALNISQLYPNIKSSHRRCSIKKVILNNSSKSTGKYLCQSVLLKKAAGLRPTTSLKMILWHILWHKCFPVHFTKFLRKHFLQNTSR